MEKSWSPELVATRSNIASHEEQITVNGRGDSNANSYAVRHTLLSPDGTSIISTSVDQQTRQGTLDSLIIPPEILDGTRHTLETYSSLSLPEPIRAISAYPYFDLSDPSTTLVLVSLPDHPLRLVNALALQSGTVASYPYIRPETEEFIAPQSVAFTQDATHFLAGADSEVSLFDVHRFGQEAIQRYKLRRRSQLNQRGQWHLKRSIVSSLAISNDDILAAGTFGREVGLFERNGQGQMITSFELSAGYKGAGVSQIAWSDCGRYLLVGERKSDAIQVFDIRGQHRLLSTLVGRKANTMMKLQWDLTSNGDVWAGGTDGLVRIWKDVGKSEGNCTAASSWKAHGDAVISTAVHSSGSIAITASSIDRHKNIQAELEHDSDRKGFIDNGGDPRVPLAIWSLPSVTSEDTVNVVIR